jgi:hypothetical protein
MVLKGGMVKNNSRDCLLKINKNVLSGVPPFLPVTLLRSQTHLSWNPGLARFITTTHNLPGFQTHHPCHNSTSTLTVLDVFCMDLLMVCHDLVNKEIKSLFL